ncbi:MAG: RNA methyltransferase [Lentisphaerae bacterium]|nr:RNA methyltransferase [Lentisphaerota bacterium]
MAGDILYGVNPAFEAVLAGRRQIRAAFLNRGAAGNARLQKLAALLQSRGVEAQWVEKGRLIDRCQSHEHQGVVLETSPYPYVTLDEIMEQPRLVLLDNIEDPHNVGAIIRSAEVLGFGGVLLPSHGVPPVLPSVVKASAGATEHLPITCAAGVSAYVHAARQRDTCIVALDGKGSASLAEVAAARPARLLLVCGGEDRGVGQFILNQAQFVVRIPQHGRIGSLNASVAAGIALHALA